MKGKVLVAIPLYSEIVFHTFPFICNMLTFTQRAHPKLYLEVKTTERVWLPYAHKRLAQYFLRGGFDYLFFLEEDLIPPVDGLVTLLNHRAPASCGVYFQRSFPYAPIPYPYNPGLGCALLSREVFEKVPFDIFKNTGEHADDDSFWKAVRGAGFEPVIDSEVCCEHIEETYKHITSEDHEKAKEKLKSSSTWVAEIQKEKVIST